MSLKFIAIGPRSVASELRGIFHYSADN